jgi:TRAP transporter TAXI family solute receptor
MRLIFCVLLGVLAAAGNAQAATSIGLVTGPKTGTYYAVGRDIESVASDAGINIKVKASEGSIDNIKRINSTENAALGIVQADVMGFLNRSKSADSLRAAGNLRVVFPLYNEEIHVLARRDIKSFAELDGKRVAIGEEGSGNMLTAVNLFSIMNVTPRETKKIPSEQGVVGVLRAEYDAVIFVGGKPVRLFKNLEDLAKPENEKYARMLDNVHFLPMNDPKMLSEYKPTQLTREDYAFVEENVPTIAVPSLLVSYDFTQVRGQGRCELLGKLARALRKDMTTLKTRGHPKWKEVNLDMDLGGWKKDSCAWR